MIPDVPYRFVVRPLTEEDGGGYLIEFPDLPGCMSDGETIEEAILSGIDAMRGWIEAMRTLFSQFPLVAVAPNGVVLLHAAPSVQLSGPHELEDVPLEVVGAAIKRVPAKQYIALYEKMLGPERLAQRKKKQKKK